MDNGHFCFKPSNHGALCDNHEWLAIIDHNRSQEKSEFNKNKRALISCYKNVYSFRNNDDRDILQAYHHRHFKYVFPS